MSSLPVIASLIILVADTRQSTLGNIDSDQGSPTQSPDEPKVEEPNPSDEPDDEPIKSDKETTESSDDVPDDQPTGLIYARVSSDGQVDEDQSDSENDSSGTKTEKGSIEGQVQTLKKKAEKKGIELLHEPITDKAETGTNFERDGIRKVFDLCLKEDIDLLLVEKIDRIGRSTPQTLYFIYLLQTECGVTLLTPAGEKDVGEMRGLLHTTLMALMADVQNEIRTTKASDESIRKFLQDKKWKAYYPKVPLGYSTTEDDWLKVDSDEKQIIRDLFRKFVQCKNYSETERYIDEKYGSDILDGHKVKTLLQNSVYIGKPRLPEDKVKETSYENDLNEPDLNILKATDDAEIEVTEDVFHRAQDIIEEKNTRHSSQEDTVDLDELLERYGLFPVVEGSKPVTLLHDCGAPLVKDGQASLRGSTVHRYKCKECGEPEDPEQYYRTWPKGYELDRIELIHKVIEGESTVFDSE